MAAIKAEEPRQNTMGTWDYRTPDTAAVRQRKALAPLRQKLRTEAGQLGLQREREHRGQGASYGDARRAGLRAEIMFMEATGLFAGAVKVARRQLAAVET
ncbi:hypothetical protein ACWC9U_20765 [Streptomyces sp. 900116325]